MNIILSKQCKSLTGSLGRGFGYFIQRRKGRFFSQRSKHKPVPPDGHWRFILACAQLAQNKLHIADIWLHWGELQNALEEAGHYVAARKVLDNYFDKDKAFYDARDIVNLQITFDL